MPYLCGLGYTDRQVAIIVQKTVKCEEFNAIPEAQLFIEPGNTSKFYTRTLTNAGPAKATSSLEMDVPFAVGMSVNPTRISFTGVNPQVTYSVEFIPQAKENRGNHVSAQVSLAWVSDKHSVRIPMSIIFT